MTCLLTLRGLVGPRLLGSTASSLCTCPAEKGIWVRLPPQFRRATVSLPSAIQWSQQSAVVVAVEVMVLLAPVMALPSATLAFPVPVTVTSVTSVTSVASAPGIDRGRRGGEAA